MEEIKLLPIEILPCKRCGKIPNLQYTNGNNWLKCECRMRSRYYPDLFEERDPDSIRYAILDWNRRNGVAEKGTE